MADRLYRSRDDVVIGGVAGGVASALDMDPSIVRVVWVLLAFLTGGIAALVYLIMLIVVPQEPAGGDPYAAQPVATAGPASEAPSGTIPPPPGTVPMSRAGPRRPGGVRRESGGALVFGVILILVGGYFLVRQYVPQIDLGLIWPVVVIAAGALLVVGSLRPGSR